MCAEVLAVDEVHAKPIQALRHGERESPRRQCIRCFRWFGKITCVQDSIYTVFDYFPDTKLEMIAVLCS